MNFIHLKQSYMNIITDNVRTWGDCGFVVQVVVDM